MNGKDIMIGDIVKCPLIEEGYGKVVENYLTTDQEPKRMIALTSHGNRYCLHVDDVFYQPIKKDLLLRLGFTKDLSIYTMTYGKYYITVCRLSQEEGKLIVNVDESDMYLMNIRVRYMSDIQHVLHLLDIFPQFYL